MGGGAHGKFTIPDIATLKTHRKPATKAGRCEMCGEIKMVKAMPTSKVNFGRRSQICTFASYFADPFG